MRYLKVLGIFYKAAILTDLESRANIVTNVLMSVVAAFATVLTVGIFSGHTATIGGWSFYEALIVVGLLLLFLGMVDTFITPNVRDGNRSMIESRIFSFDLEALTSPFEKPTLILTGRQDTHVGYHDAWNILEKYPRATFAVLDRAGHALGVERVNLFEAFVHEWLERVEELSGYE